MLKIHKEGNKLILEPTRKTWTSLPKAGLTGDDSKSGTYQLRATTRDIRALKGSP